MKNYICLNGKKTELTAEQVAELKKSLGVGEVRLGSIPTGKTFKLGKFELVVLEHEIGDAEGGTAVILKDLYEKNVRFGENNNFVGSNASRICLRFADELADIIGHENIITHTVDLTSDDGLKDYGTTECRASLLTADLYRRYVYTLDKYKLDDWQWLATPWSTPTHEDSTCVKCVSPSGIIGDDFYHFNFNGVRPFCILKSDIFVSF